LLWVATTYRTFRAADVVPAGVVLTSPAGVEVAPRGWLITIGEPVRVTAYAEGRIATLDELMASIASGLPTLTALAEAEGAVDAFTQQATTAVQALVRLVAATGTQAQEAP
jgi:hypothetical protein